VKSEIINKNKEFNIKNYTSDSQRIRREIITIEKMILIFCRKNHHSTNTLCPDCNTMKDYAFERLLNCPFEATKPVCSNCEIHCYKPEMRAKIKKIMGFSGPRMLFKHPYLAIMHLLDEKLIK
jgi:hypothetical protein